MGSLPLGSLPLLSRIPSGSASLPCKLPPEQPEGALRAAPDSSPGVVASPASAAPLAVASLPADCGFSGTEHPSVGAFTIALSNVDDVLALAPTPEGFHPGGGGRGHVPLACRDRNSVPMSLSASSVCAHLGRGLEGGDVSKGQRTSKTRISLGVVGRILLGMGAELGILWSSINITSKQGVFARPGAPWSVAL